MEHAIVVRGSLSDSTHIELDEPVTGIQGMVEVVLRAVTTTVPSPQPAVEPPWDEAFVAWVEGHDRSVPLPLPASLRREDIYEDRG